MEERQKIKTDTDDTQQIKSETHTSESEDKYRQPTQEELRAVSPIAGLFPKWDRNNQSIGKILLYCLAFVVILVLIGYFGTR